MWFVNSVKLNPKFENKANLAPPHAFQSNLTKIGRGNVSTKLDFNDWHLVDKSNIK